MAFQFDTKPLAKLPVIRQRAPDPRNGRLEFNTLLNPVIHIKQPPGCILAWRGTKSNLAVALYAAHGRRYPVSTPWKSTTTV